MFSKNYFFFLVNFQISVNNSQENVTKWKLVLDKFQNFDISI